MPGTKTPFCRELTDSEKRGIACALAYLASPFGSGDTPDAVARGAVWAALREERRTVRELLSKSYSYSPDSAPYVERAKAKVRELAAQRESRRRILRGDILWVDR